MTSWPCLVLVPAYGIGTGFWRPLAARWEGPVRVHALAGYEDGARRRTFDDHVADVLRVVDDIDGDVALVGHCASTKVVAAAAAIGRRCYRLVLFCPNFAPDALDAGTAAPLGSELVRVARLVRDRPTILRHLTARSGGAPGYLPPEIAALTTLGREPDRDTLVRYYTAVAEYHEIPWRLPDAARVPVTAVVASGDPYVDPRPPPGWAAWGAAVTTVDGDDHFFPWRRPELAAAILAEHLQPGRLHATGLRQERA